MQMSLRQLFALGWFAIPVTSLLGQDVTEKFIPSGVTAKVGGYRPIPVEMDLEADIISQAPEGLESPKYGKFEIGDKSWAFILDEHGDGKIYIDTNADGDLTNDPEANWKSKPSGEFKQYSGDGQLELDNGKLGRIAFYRFDPTDESRVRLKNTLLFYTDFGSEYTFELDGQEFSTFAAGNLDEDASFSIDRDGNGRISSRLERASVGKPFNFTGTTYVLGVSNGSLTLEKADEEIEMQPLPPDLRIGQPSLTFTATTMDGREVTFPKDYAGRIVMLDFWATWCGPCIGEIPNMKEAYATWHEAGFDILGISFDREEMADKITEFLEEKELTWPQIYEGKYWNTTLGLQHDVGGIPFVLLVDGDSGKILATARQLRGPGLTKFIGQQLAEKYGEEPVPAELPSDPKTETDSDEPSK